MYVKDAIIKKYHKLSSEEPIGHLKTFRAAWSSSENKAGTAVGFGICFYLRGCSLFGFTA